MFIGFSSPRKGYETCFVPIAVKKIPMELLSAADAEWHSQHLQLNLHLSLQQHLLQHP
jgi:hypothetical protein